jgi:hypothetical protein
MVEISITRAIGGWNLPLNILVYAFGVKFHFPASKMNHLQSMKHFSILLLYLQWIFRDQETKIPKKSIDFTTISYSFMRQVFSYCFQEVASLYSCRERKKNYTSTPSHVQQLKLPTQQPPLSIFHQLMQNAEPGIDKLVLFLWPLCLVIFMVLPGTNQDNCPKTVDRFVKLKLLSQIVLENNSSTKLWQNRCAQSHIDALMVYILPRYPFQDKGSTLNGLSTTNSDSLQWKIDAGSYKNYQHPL